MSAAEKDMSQVGVEASSLFIEDQFQSRHIGPDDSEIAEMMKVIGVKSVEELIEKTIPAHIRLEKDLEHFAPMSERALLSYLRSLAQKNKLYRSYIGQGYYATVTPPVIQRNILENPGWYTQYTPYQAEIAQGRLEALANFQTMISDLTAMDLANASLLDEGTAAAEAMTVCARANNNDASSKFFVADDCHPQTIDVVQTRAIPLGIEVVVGKAESFKPDNTYFAALLQYPNTFGEVVDYQQLAQQLHDAGALLIVASDLLALTMLTPPGEWGADIVVGNSQRFGVPVGFGGPHAAFFACKDQFKRDIPGRLIGLSKDASGKPAYRLALQTREQHIRRDKATSNICTAQVLLAIMAGMYGVYHGEQGLKRISARVHGYTRLLKQALEQRGVKVLSKCFFDTLLVECKNRSEIEGRSEKLQLNFRLFKESNLLGISLNEETTLADLRDILEAICGDKAGEQSLATLSQSLEQVVGGKLLRTSSFMQHPVFSMYRSETQFLRYLKRLEAKDLSLTTSMIPLGSCTMKLNAAAEMLPITWPEFAQIHPFAPLSQSLGWQEVISELEGYLAQVTSFAGASVQPNAGSQGEYAGLLVIQAWHQSRGEAHRDICLIPTSAHGTNPASAVMAGMKVVTVKCDDSGNIDLPDLKEKAAKYAPNLSCLMVTYPSTHGVFETAITEVCKVIHDHGGQVYMDGANLNAQVGLTSPAKIGADVCHINLHKTFCIPHGGGGPGVGPIAVAAHLAPFLPGHVNGGVGGEKAIGAISAAPWGSALILLISLAYIKMMGSKGLKEATEVAILNANYIAKRLEPHFPVLYKGENGFVAHECILDLRNLKRTVALEAQDIAKRLMDYGFHAPTVSFPVVETLMVEPTESESKDELDRFCESMIAIREEIREVEQGKVAVEDSILRQAPHTAQVVIAQEWTRSYSREQAAYPAPWLRNHKYWPPVSRIDNVYGDRNLFCACAPVDVLE